MKRVKKYINTALLNLFSIIVKRKTAKNKIRLNNQSKVLLVQLGSITDALLCTPLIKIIRGNTNAKIDLTCSKSNLDVFLNNSSISKIIKLEPEFVNILKAVWELRKNSYDVAIDLNENFSKESTILLGLLNTKYKVGFAKVNNRLFTHPITNLNKTKNHKVDRLLHLLNAFDFDYSKKDLNIICSATQQADNTIQKFLNEKNIAGKLLICINISGEDKFGDWETDNYKNIVKYLLNYNVNIIITSSVYNITNAEKIADNNCYVFYNTDFNEYISLIKVSDFIFTPESYTVHLAAAYNKPVFVLFKQDKENEMMKVPYNSDFDFVLTEKESLAKLSYGQVLNSFIPYFDYIYERYNTEHN